MRDFWILRFIAAIAIVTGSCVLLTALSGCGPHPLGRGATSTEVVPAAGLQPAIELARDAQVTCADAKLCPEGVGMLVVANENGVELCTGSLVGPDLVLTAGHCVPPALRAEVACGDRIRFLLPASTGAKARAQQSQCGSVLGQKRLCP